MHVSHNQLVNSELTKEHTLKEKADLVLYFGSKDLVLAPSTFPQLRELYPHAKIVGCSTGGEIMGSLVDDDTLVMTAIDFEDTEIRLASVSLHDFPDSFDAGEQLGKQLRGHDLSAVFVLSDGLQVNATDIIRGMIAQVGTQIPVTGGLAGDGERFEKTYVGADAPATERTLAAIGFYGDAIHVGHGSVGGWDTFGPERLITHSEGNVLYEFDGKPALELYKRYLGEEAENLPSSALLFPISIRPVDDKDTALVRTVLAIDEDTQSMTFSGDVPQGQVAQLMRGDNSRLVDGASAAAHQARSFSGEGDQIAILISCIGRKLLMGQYIDDEVEMVSSVLGEQVPAIGFYSYGEISPHETSGKCSLHNQTMTITTLSEKKKTA